MEKVKNLIKKIECEMNDAERYADEAILNSHNRLYCELLMNLSKEELGHAEKLYSYCVTVIAEHQKTYGELSPSILSIWNKARDVYIPWKASILEKIQIMKGCV